MTGREAELLPAADPGDFVLEGYEPAVDDFGNQYLARKDRDDICHNCGQKMVVAYIGGGSERDHGLDSLSPRERDILAAYPRLGRYALIRAELHMGQQTIKNHVSSIIRKLGVVTLGQAAVLFDREQRR